MSDTKNQAIQASKRTKRTGILLVALLATIALTTPAAHGDPPEPDQDLGITVEAGEYIAYRVEMPSSGWIHLGGQYLDAESDTSVLPIVHFLDEVDSAYVGTAGFYYDNFRDESIAADVMVVNDELGNHNIHTHEKRVGSPIPSLNALMPAGTYNMVAMTGPADGQAEIVLEVPEDAQVLDTQRGDSIWARGLDESPIGYDLRFQTQYGLAQSDYHEWYYTGADVDVEIEGTFYGYMGFGRYTEAHWLLDGQWHDGDWVIGESAGTWTMSFPEEHYQWKNCVSSVCVGDQNQNLRLYPPYAIGVDVDWD